MSSFAIILAISVSAGFLGSLLGLGGGIIVIPALTAGMGFPLRAVIGASLVSVIATSSGAGAAYVRDRLTNMRVAMFLELGTTTGAFAGAFLAVLLDPKYLYFLFAAVLLYSAAGMFQRRNLEGAGRVPPSRLAERLHMEGSYHDELLGREVSYRPGRVIPGLGVMVGAGALSGILGIGSGLFKVLGLDMVMGLPIKVSTATSNFMIGVTAAASASVYFARGDIRPDLAAPVALGVLAGAWVGSKLLPHLPGKAIRYLFIPLLIYMAVEMLRQGVMS
ncbi:sulfite exporter TauE/SafE family protein [Limnochorda pilosa]|uniref:Probable membrane transporter protein n=1 Tax=Limnochorda pilosa TaxID=1555112 RepID=A0A0K2SHF9_LIMPI|nr:permease [Limnochorda pilosa]